MRRALGVAAMLVGALLTADCATEGSGSVGVGVGYYDTWYDSWYVGGSCCADYPGDVGPPPHPEHPIVKPPISDTPRPSNPIANVPSSRPMPSPRPAAMGRGGGGRR